MFLLWRPHWTEAIVFPRMQTPFPISNTSLHKDLNVLCTWSHREPVAGLTPQSWCDVQLIKQSSYTSDAKSIKVTSLFTQVNNLPRHVLWAFLTGDISAPAVSLQMSATQRWPVMSEETKHYLGIKKGCLSAMCSLYQLLMIHMLIWGHVVFASYNEGYLFIYILWHRSCCQPLYKDYVQKHS